MNHKPLLLLAVAAALAPLASADTSYLVGFRRVYVIPTRDSHEEDRYRIDQEYQNTYDAIVAHEDGEIKLIDDLRNEDADATDALRAKIHADAQAEIEDAERRRDEALAAWYRPAPFDYMEYPVFTTVYSPWRPLNIIEFDIRGGHARDYIMREPYAGHYCAPPEGWRYGRPVTQTQVNLMINVHRSVHHDRYHHERSEGFHPARSVPDRSGPGRNDSGRHEPGRHEPGRHEPGRHEPARNEDRRRSDERTRTEERRRQEDRKRPDDQKRPEDSKRNEDRRRPDDRKRPEDNKRNDDRKPTRTTPPTPSTPPARTAPPARTSPPARTAPPARTTPPARSTPPVRSAPPAKSTPPTKSTPPPSTPPKKKP